MNLVWTLLLALVAGNQDVTTRPAPKATMVPAAPLVKAQATAEGRSFSLARRSWRRPGSCSCFLAGPDDLDTEEVDESWMVHLDAVANLPGAWPFSSWTRLRSDLTRNVDPAPLSCLAIPLRC